MQLLKTLLFGDEKLDRFQQNVKNALDPISKLQIIDGILLEDVVLTTASTAVSHKLGRQPVMWILADQSDNAVVWRTAWDDKTITLDCSANCTVKLWVA